MRFIEGSLARLAGGLGLGLGLGVAAGLGGRDVVSVCCY